VNIFEPQVSAPAGKTRFVEKEEEKPFEEEAAGAEGNRSIVMKRETSAFRWFFVFVIVIIGVLVGKSAYLQIMKSSEYEELAAGNRNRIVPVLAPRGIIFDRNGKELVTNAPSFDAALIPVDLPEDDIDRDSVFSTLSEIIGISKEELVTLADEVDPFTFEPIVVKENIEREEALRIEADQNNLPGVSVEKVSVREYPYKDAVSYIMGYVGKISEPEYEEKMLEKTPYLLNDVIGKAGVEQSYENVLRGSHGKRQVEVDSKGRVMKVLATKEPLSGENVVLSVNIDLQEKIRSELEKAVDAANVSRASAVAMDPRNGEILALVNYPSFDNNLFAKGIKEEDYQKLLHDPAKPLFNKAASGTYPPGSTYKPFVAAAALAEGIVTPDTVINSTGKISVGVWDFFDYDLGGHGATSLYKAIAKSVNTYFYYVGGGYEDFHGLGIERLVKNARNFGFGSLTQVDIAADSAGLLPTPEWKERVKNEPWYVGDTYHAAIGQGDVSVSPLQLATAYCVIANKGTYYKPHVMRASFTDDIENMTMMEHSGTNSEVMSSEILGEVKRAMHETVLSGSGRSLNTLPFTSAGKTGTAQYVIPNSGGEKGEHAWYASFAPYEEPNIVLIVLVEEAGGGHEHAVPVAKEVLKWYFTDEEERNKEPNDEE